MNQITLRYGTREMVREFPSGTSVREIRMDGSVRVGLGLGENVQAVVDGRTLSDHDRLNDGDVVSFEKQAAAKAS